MHDLEQTIRERAYHLWVADGHRDWQCRSTLARSPARGIGFSLTKPRQCLSNTERAEEGREEDDR